MTFQAYFSLESIENKLLLRKHSVIESVNDFLKNICQIEHSLYRSVANFFINVVAGIAAYSFLPSKPSILLPSPTDEKRRSTCPASHE